ncbi:unnamed protein product [Lampetra fluviatilis]
MGRVVASKGRGISLRATRPDRWRAAAIVAAGGGGGGGGQRSCGEAPREARESCQAAWDVAPATAEGGGSCSLLRMAGTRLCVGRTGSLAVTAATERDAWSGGSATLGRVRLSTRVAGYGGGENDAAGIVRTMRRLRHAPSHSPAATHPPDCPIAHCGVTAPRGARGRGREGGQPLAAAQNRGGHETRGH